MWLHYFLFLFFVSKKYRHVLYHTCMILVLRFNPRYPEVIVLIYIHCTAKQCTTAVLLKPRFLRHEECFCLSNGRCSWFSPSKRSNCPRRPSPRGSPWFNWNFGAIQFEIDTVSAELWGKTCRRKNKKRQIFGRISWNPPISNRIESNFRWIPGFHEVAAVFSRKPCLTLRRRR